MMQSMKTKARKPRPRQGKGSSPDRDKASDKRTVQNFRSEVLRELKKIKMAWPELNYSTAPGVLILLPSTPAIAPLNQGQRWLVELTS